MTLESRSSQDPEEKKPVTFDIYGHMQSDWEDLSPVEQELLIKMYGEPITIEGTIRIANREVAGSCDANESSLLALNTDQKYWSYYSLGVVNKSMLVWRLELYDRIMSSKIVKGSLGGMVLPGIIYKEAQRFGGDPKASIRELLNT